MEYQVHIAVEKPPPVPLKCCTPQCSNPAILNSHTLQKQKVLQHVQNKQGVVYQTKLTPFSGETPLKKVSTRFASVFPGFCSQCEQSKFAEAESHEAELNKSNALVLAWRAACFIRFRRAQELKIRGLIVSQSAAYELSTIHSDPITPMAATAILKTNIYSYRILDKWVKLLERGNYDARKDLAVFALAAPNIPFVGAGIIMLPLGFDRQQDPTTSKFYQELPSIVYTTMVVGGVPQFIFVARKRDKMAMRFCMSLLSLDLHLLSCYLPQLIIGGSDTVFFSEKYIESRASVLDKHILNHSQNMKFPQMVFPFWGKMSEVEVTKASLIA